MAEEEDAELPSPQNNNYLEWLLLKSTWELAGQLFYTQGCKKDPQESGKKGEVLGTEKRREI